ncbi:MAG: ribonuclease J, partial [Coriobacteriales bacterium]|nr:ribonuclease J [Coriobacteriales bacterium]
MANEEIKRSKSNNRTRRKRSVSLSANSDSSTSTNTRSSENKKNTFNKKTNFSNKTNRKPRRNLSKLKIIPLGGLDAIGKNMTVFEYDTDIILVDAGLMFPDDEHIGIDLVLPDYTYILEKPNKLKGIFITHGHEDHIGAIPYLLQDLDMSVPIYGSKLSLAMIESKLEEFSIKNKPTYHEVQNESVINCSQFSLEFFSVNHSIPGAMGIFIHCPAGNVLHTGDFKLDQTPIDGVRTNFQAINRFSEKGVDLLLSDSTNANKTEFTKSEAEVGVALRHIIKNAKQKVVVAAFSSHIHRVQQVFDAAKLARRKVVVTGRSMLTNIRIAKELGYLDIDDDSVIDAYQCSEIPPHRIVILCTGSQGEPLSALSRLSVGEHKTLEIGKGDTVIISATPVPGNEKMVAEVINKLVALGAAGAYKKFEEVHVSGHAKRAELTIMQTLVN